MLPLIQSTLSQMLLAVQKQESHVSMHIFYTVMWYYSRIMLSIYRAVLIRVRERRSECMTQLPIIVVCVVIQKKEESC